MNKGDALLNSMLTSWEDRSEERKKAFTSKPIDRPKVLTYVEKYQIDHKQKMSQYKKNWANNNKDLIRRRRKLKQEKDKQL
ncbi:hypothetical protein COB55_03115 [Candidatus Wolfebacteria bacterium]|nr:MAG: hypothetical protein COB55_03115 [Candidatus Wolfebacteria bacterium]